MRQYGHGLVLGKFYPLHAGHQQLIRSASARCDRLTVLVLASSVESIPLEVRADWIRREHPEVEVVAGMDELPVDFEDADVWDAHMRLIEALLPGPVDVVLTSDDYGAEMARRLDADWIQVDPGRQAMPVSGTAIRADVADHWWALPAPVRQWFCRRVVIIGAESTGTTTLATDLADRFGVPWVPEFGREWSSLRPGGLSAPWHTAEFDLVAAEHRHQEEAAMRHTPRPLIISDTDVLATTIWHERYVGGRSATVEAAARAWRPDLYIITGDEIPFVQDGMRDGEHLRHAMQQPFRRAVIDSNVPWIEVQGTPSERLDTASAAVESVLSRRWNLADPLG